MKTPKTFWAIRVGNLRNAYFMDSLVFERRKDAQAHFNKQLPCSWSHQWKIVKIKEVV